MKAEKYKDKKTAILDIAHIRNSKSTYVKFKT